MLFHDWLHPLRWKLFGGQGRRSAPRRDHKRQPLWSNLAAQVEVFERRDLPYAGPVGSTMADLGRLDLLVFPSSQAQLPDWGTAFQLQHGQIDNMTEFAPADIGNYSDTINQSDSWGNSYSDEHHDDESQPQRHR